jgi:hypothetical protein
MAKLRSDIAEQWWNQEFIKSNGKTKIRVGHSGNNDKDPMLNGLDHNLMILMLCMDGNKVYVYTISLILHAQLDVEKNSFLHKGDTIFNIKLLGK